MFKKLLTGFLLCLIVLNLTGCVNEDEYDSDVIHVVVTTTMLHDLVSTIGGDAISCVGLMNEGIDPHSYSASAGDIDKMNNADIVVYNGLNLEGQMAQIFSNLNTQGKFVIGLENGIDTDLLLMDEDGFNFDPHIWFDVSLWKEAAIYVSNMLVEYDIDNSEFYLENLNNYLLELDSLECYILDRINELSLEGRILITAHDAFNYFGNRYGFEVLGLQGVSTDSEASTSDISYLSDYIVTNKINAIFPETSTSSKSIEALQEATKSRGVTVLVANQLFSDSLGDSASDTETYIKTFKYNIDTIVDALK